MCEHARLSLSVCQCVPVCVCVCKLLEFVEIVTSIKFHSILKEFSTDDAQVISEIGYCMPTANKQASVCTCVLVCVCACVWLSLVLHVCVCVYICIKSNFNCAYLSLGKYLQRAFDSTGSLSAWLAPFPSLHSLLFSILCSLLYSLSSLLLF